MPLSREQGSELVAMARAALEEFVRLGKVSVPERWNEDYLNAQRGVFVTLKKLDGSLRGCIGFPFPIKALGSATVEAAVAAAANDPRFPPVAQREVPQISVEVSVLTQPEVIKVRNPTEYPRMIRKGVDGLIVSNRSLSGLLLPQVATEFELGPEDFLSETCVKAGLMPDAWLTDGVTVQKFQTEIFSEELLGEKVSKEAR